MVDSTVFPAIIRAQYDPAGGFPKMVEDAKASSAQIKRQFEADFSEIGRIAQNALAKGLGSGGALNLDVSGFKAGAAQANAYRLSLEEMQRAAQKLARETGDTSAATSKYLQALSAQVIEARQAEQVASAQAATYSRLQAEVNANATAVGRLADSYRRLELARNADAIAAAGAELRNRRFTEFDQSRGVGANVTSSARESAAAFQAMFAAEEKVSAETDRLKREADLASQAIQELMRAEAGAVNGAILLAGAHRDTALEIGRSAKSAQESARVFEQVFAAQAVINQRRFASFAAPNADGTAKSARDSARAFEELFRAEEKVATASAGLARDLEMVRRAIDPTRVAQQQLDAELARADRAFEAGAVSAREYGLAVNAAADRFGAYVTGAKQGTTADHMMVNSQRSLRQATVQTGQQLQDVAISLYGGQKASVVLAQQLPQLAFALSGAGGRVGAMATVLSGPWSLAVVAGGALLGHFIGKLWETEDATKKVKDASETLADKLDFLQHSYVKVLEATREYNQEQERARTLTLDSAAAVATKTAANIDAAIAARKLLQAELEKEQSAPAVRRYDPETGGYITERDNYRAGVLKSALEINSKQLAELETGARNAVSTVADEMAKIQTDPKYAIEERFKRLANAAKEAHLPVAELTKRLAELNRQKESALDALSPSTRNSPSDGVSRFKSQQQAIGIAGREILGAGFRVSENAQFGGVKANHPGMGNTAHGLNAIDVNAGAGVNEASIPDLKKQFDEMARRYQARGYRVLWNGQVYEANGDGPGGAIKKGSQHTDHMHIEAPGTIVGKPTQSGTEGAAQAAMRVAEQLAQHQAKLAEFGNDAGAKIANIRDSFDETPPAVERMNDALRATADLGRQIDDAMSEGLDPATAEALKASLASLEPVIRNSVNKPFEDMKKAADDRRLIEDALLTGGEAMAQIKERELALEKQMKTVSSDQLAEVRNIVVAEHQRARAIEEQTRAQQRQLDVINQTRDNIRDTIYGLLKGGGFGSIGDFFKKQWDIMLGNMADNLMSSLGLDKFFGDQKDKVLGYDKVHEASVGVSTSLDTLSADIETAAQRIRDALDGDLIGGLGGGSSTGLSASDPLAVAFDKVFGAANDNEIEVLGKRIGKAAGVQIGGVLEPVISVLPQGVVKGLGTIFTGAALGQIGGGFVGANQSTGGQIGSVLGGIAGETLKGGATKALTGVLGKTIGGILGGAIPIIGGLLGGLIGGLFKKSPSGSGSVTQDGISVSANNSKVSDNLNSIGGQLQASVSKIAQALGGTLGSYSVGIGQKDDYFQISDKAGDPRLGKNDFWKLSPDQLYDGKDASAALAAAIRNAIDDGAVKGIREGAKRLLAAGKDLDQQLAKAIKFQNVFDELDSIKDPMGHAVRTLNREFEELIAIFKEAGSTTEEYAQLEELYGLKRAEAIKQQTEATKQANEALTSSLKDLIGELEVGDSGLSLRDRLGNAKAIYDPMAEAIRSGQSVDYDKFANAARDVIDITRQIFGSQEEYFRTFNDVLGLSKQALEKEGSNVVSIDTNGLPASPFTTQAANDNSSLISALDKLGLQLVADLGIKLDAVNDNLGALIQMGLASGAIVPSYNFAATSYF